jgi:RsiW-degrading membrane proteinase PrsW (M82 family)
MKTCHIIWRGQQTGPFSEKEILQKIENREISMFHRIRDKSENLTVEEWLKKRQPASVASPPPPPVRQKAPVASAPALPPLGVPSNGIRLLFSQNSPETPVAESAQNSVLPQPPPPPQSIPAPFPQSPPHTAQPHIQPAGGDTPHENFKIEIFPVDSRNAHEVFGSSVFWTVSALGILPLLIGSFNHFGIQLYGLLFFFALMWAGIFQKFILKYKEKLWLPIVSFFFTGLAGIYILDYSNTNIFSKSYLDLPFSSDVWTRLFGFVARVGVCEEICKILPVLIYVLLCKFASKKISVGLIVLIGVFSGLGFAFFENIGYAKRDINDTIQGAFEGIKQNSKEGVIWGVGDGVISSMINIMLRSLSLTFAHAVYTAIFSYFIAVSCISKKHEISLPLLGLLVSAVIHGPYNWLCGIQFTFAAVINFGAFILFYAYFTKLQKHLGQGTLMTEVQTPSNT